MATPVGHYFLGLAITQASARDNVERKRGFGLATVALLPDLDVIPGLLLGNLSQFHHGPTHSLTFAALFSVVSLLLLTLFRKQNSLHLLMLLFLLYTSHIALDYFTLDTGIPYGVPLYWPWLSETYRPPWVLLPNVQHTAAPLVSLHNLLLVIQETLLFIPLVGVVYYLKGQLPARAKAVGWFCGGWFLIAVIASVLWVNGPS